MEQHAVVLERERPLGPRARRAPRSARASSESQYASTNARDPLELLVGHRRVPRRARRSTSGARGRREVDELEQAVHRVADLGRLQARPPPGASAALLAQAGDALGVVAVRAALEQRERRVREAPHLVERRRGSGTSSGSR